MGVSFKKKIRQNGIKWIKKISKIWQIIDKYRISTKNEKSGKYVSLNAIVTFQLKL